MMYGEWFLLLLLLVNIFGWVITLSERIKSSKISQEQLRMSKIRFDREEKEREEILTASEAYEKGFRDGKGSRL